MYPRFNHPKNTNNNFIKILLALLFVGPVIIGLLVWFLFRNLPPTTTTTTTGTPTGTPTTTGVQQHASTRNRHRTSAWYRSPKTKACFRTCVMCKNRDYGNCDAICHKCATKLGIKETDIK